MAPKLTQVYRRRWWIAVTSIIENLMFAAVLLGWSSLLLMLKNEGFYSHLCEDKNGSSTTDYNQTSLNTSTFEPSLKETSSLNETDENTFHHFNTNEDAVRFTPSGKPTCQEQDELLNRYFSIGSSLLSGVTIILGIIMDKYGSRMIRLCGTLAFMLSCVLFALGSLDTNNYSILIAPAVCLNGMGGVVYIFTSFPVPNLFEDLRSTMISLMIGSYSASAIMYMLFKAAYDAGVPFVAIMLFHAAIGFLTFLNCYFNTPGEPIPGPDDLSYAIKLQFGSFRFEHKVSGKKFLKISTDVGRRMSSVETVPAHNHNYLTSFIDLKDKEDSSNQEMSFLKVLVTPCVLLSFVTMCLTQLRLIAYMGGLELYFRSSCNHKGFDEQQTRETVDLYALIFGLLQINCFFMAPVIGTIMDWKLKPKKKSKSKKKNMFVKLNQNGNVEIDTEENSHVGNGKPTSNGVSKKDKHPKRKKATNEATESNKKLKRKKQQVSNLFRAFLITNTLLFVFGIVVLFEDFIELQILAFIIHTIVRTFLHSSMGGLYACMYHFSHFGKLTGLASFLSAMFILIQDPLFVIVNSSFGGDPFWINVTLLVLTLFGFGLPIYLWLYRRRLNSEKADVEEERKMFTITEEEEDEEENDNESISSSDEEPATYLSSMALAL